MKHLRLNNGATRFGWTYNGAKKADVLSLRIGKTHFDIPGTAVTAGANPVRDGAVAGVVGGIVTTPTQAQAASTGYSSNGSSPLK